MANRDNHLTPTKQVKTTPTPSSGRGGWQNALISYINNPDDPLVVYQDNDVCIIKDMYPKAERHFLVIPKKIGGFESIDIDSIPMIEMLYRHAKRIVVEYVC